MTNEPETTREAVGIFKDDAKLQAAISELCLEHFERYDISVLGSESAIRKKFSKEHQDPHELADNPATPRGINVAPEELGVAKGVVIGSSVLAGVVAALIGAGGIALPSSIPATIIGITAGTA